MDVVDRRARTDDKTDRKVAVGCLAWRRCLIEPVGIQRLEQQRRHETPDEHGGTSQARHALDDVHQVRDVTGDQR